VSEAAADRKSAATWHGNVSLESVLRANFGKGFSFLGARHWLDCSGAVAKIFRAEAAEERTGLDLAFLSLRSSACSARVKALVLAFQSSLN